MSILRYVLAMLLLSALVACGGGGGSDAFVSKKSSNQPTGNSGEEVSDDPLINDLVFTNNQFIATVCPTLSATLAVGASLTAADVVACENEALGVIYNDNDQHLEALCPVATAQAELDTTAITLVTEISFLPACLEESLSGAGGDLDDLLDDDNDLVDLVCPDAETVEDCIVDIIESDPETTPEEVIELLDCEEGQTLYQCLVAAGQDLENAMQLISNDNTLSQTLCPAAADAMVDTSEANAELCLAEIVGNTDATLNLGGGMAAICGSDTAALTCLINSGELIGPVVESTGGEPLDPTFIDNLVADLDPNTDLSEPSNLDLLEGLGDLLDAIPGLADLINSAYDEDPANFDLFEFLNELLAAYDIIDTLPALGGIIDDLLGDDGNNDIPLDVDELLDNLSPEALALISPLLDSMPTVKPLLNEILGAFQCGSDASTCLANAQASLADLNTVLLHEPELAELLNRLLDTLLGQTSGSLLQPAIDLLAEVPEAIALTDLIDEMLKKVFGDPEELGEVMLSIDAFPGVSEKTEATDILLTALISGLLDGSPLSIAGYLDEVKQDINKFASEYPQNGYNTTQLVQWLESL
ncbi:hypothetical protein MWU49_11800 [Alcanivorax sp. S6407]|uniref:hypothetical protein n=1 Tax=Alcanivorax sp. S6407 TaxID=2926424 RepID=UPI001FF1EE60|nr:hypothetical protein [Alcanivorax sp. S6407]MCK0154390.1 hypothetical protein [Alcanivorax sp. S6407]